MFPLVSDCPHICCLHNQPPEVECVRQIKTKVNAVRLKNPLPLRTAMVPTIILPSRGFRCCTPKTTSSPRHHLRDVSTASSPGSSTIASTASVGDSPCPPAIRTCCSRALSHHTFRRALRCNCRCGGPQPCIGSISSTEPSLSPLHRLNRRCRCLSCLFHALFRLSHRNHSLLCRRSQAIWTSLSTCQKMSEASRICCG